MAILVGGNDCSGCSAEVDEEDAKFIGLEECICRRPEAVSKSPLVRESTLSERFHAPRHAADRAANAALPARIYQYFCPKLTSPQNALENAATFANDMVESG